ncbi:luc7-like protein 3 isoform X1 [Brachyistius frenatus]|uniref:luc7-like protein 3 isoform X1 n=2 Tax=Brachyistius frenatus TaxID=100188 RepID=UPI0037E9291D
MATVEVAYALEAKPAFYKWSDEDTRSLIAWRAANASLFTGRRNAAMSGYETYIASRGLEGRVNPAFVKKKWENLKQKYKDLKCLKAVSCTKAGESSATSWKWYSLMEEAIGGTLLIIPPVLIASSSHDDMAMMAPPSMMMPELDTATTSMMESAPKRLRLDAMEMLTGVQGKEERFEVEVRQIVVGETKEKEEPRTGEGAEGEERRHREAVEREERRHSEALEREERRHQEAVEREERRHRDAIEREERFFREMRDREDRRDRETAAREERFLALLETLSKK